MTPTLNRRGWLAGAAAATAAVTLPAGALAQGTAAKAASGRPHRIYAITFRGNTEVERGFEAYFAAHKIPVQITYRDLNRDPTRMAGFLDEIRASRPDLVYTWGTSVTLGVVGPYDGVVAGQHIDNIPVVFTMVASPVLARIVPAAAGAARRNLTGVTHVAPTDAQIRAISAYRPFNTLGVLYTSTERNSVVVLDEIRKIGREKGIRTAERTFKLDGARKPTAEGAADLVRELKEAGAQWLYLPPDSYLGTQAEAVVIPAAMAAGLPTFASTEQLMQAGALSGLVSRYQDIGQFTAHKVEQILVDKQAASAVPIETLKRFSYQIRMPAAQRLQLLPPLAMMSYAEIINSEAAPS